MLFVLVLVLLLSVTYSDVLPPKPYERCTHEDCPFSFIIRSRHGMTTRWCDPCTETTDTEESLVGNLALCAPVRTAEGKTVPAWLPQSESTSLAQHAGTMRPTEIGLPMSRLREKTSKSTRKLQSQTNRRQKHAKQRQATLFHSADGRWDDVN